MKTIDMIGQPCPIPVINAKKALDEAGIDGVQVLVDNFVAVQNLEKMANGTGRAFSYVEDSSNHYTVSILIGEGSLESADTIENIVENIVEPQIAGSVVLITANHLGEGADELGKMLIKGFIFSLTEQSPLPKSVLFLNGGAHLTTEGANTIPDLVALEQQGVEILTCGTCANYYNLTEHLAVGAITDMMGIVNRLMQSAHVITI